MPVVCVRLCLIDAGVVCALQEFSGAFTTYDRYNSDLRYTGRVHKTTNDAGRTTITMRMVNTDSYSGERVVVTVLNHRAYKQVFNDTVDATTPTRVECLPANLIPPVSDLDEVFRNGVATPTTQLDTSIPGMAACADAGERWLLRWGFQEFVYCRPHNNVHTVVGDNFHTTFVADTDAQPVANVAIPTNVTSGEPAVCHEVVEFSALAEAAGHPHDVNLARRVSVDGPPSRRLGVRVSFSRSSAPPKRPCVFLGGLGITKDESTKSSQKEEDYWGTYITG